MTIYDTDELGNMVVLYDSRWQWPELLGYKPTDPEYEMLRGKHKEYMNDTIDEQGDRNPGEVGEAGQG